jgi:hypothetical protein
MKKYLLLALVFATSLLFTACNMFKTDSDAKIHAIPGNYKIESVRFNPKTQKSEKFEGRLKMFEAIEKFYIAGEEKSLSNPNEAYKFTGDGKYDEETKTLTLNIKLKDDEKANKKYETTSVFVKTDNGFKWVPDENINSSQNSEEWIKVN